LSKPSAKASLFFRNSSMALISAPFGLGPPNMLKATCFRSLRGRVGAHELEAAI
jgi:hypothetical protein